MANTHKKAVYVVDPYHDSALDVFRDAASSIDLISADNSKVKDWRSEADGLMVRSATRVTAADLKDAKKLKVIVKQGVGVDNIDVEAAKQHGIAVCNTPALNSEAVAELTITLALSSARRVSELDRRIRNGEKVDRTVVLGQSLFEKTIGIVGMGNIGRTVAEKWIAAMKGDVIAYDPIAPQGAWEDLAHTRAQSLDELLSQADVISLHVPLTKGTEKMIGEKQLALMKKTAIFVNAARGGIVDEKAVLDALTKQRIWGAALDAMEVEPPTLKAYGDLLGCGNLIMTPHIGGNTIENQLRSGRAAAQTMLDVLTGKDVPNRIV